MRDQSAFRGDRAWTWQTKWCEALFCKIEIEAALRDEISNSFKSYDSGDDMSLNLRLSNENWEKRKVHLGKSIKLWSGWVWAKMNFKTTRDKWKLRWQKSASHPISALLLKLSATSRRVGPLRINRRPWVTADKRDQLNLKFKFDWNIAFDKLIDMYSHV